MIMNALKYPAVLALLILFAGCDTTSPSVHDEELVVESYLVAGEELPPIWLTRSLDVDGVWTESSAAVNDASVVVMMVEENGTTAETFVYERTFSAPGKYVPATQHVVKSGARYRLEAATTGLDPVSAETLVPESFEVLDVSHTEIEYLDPEQFSYLVTRSSFADRQSIFVFTIASGNPVPENLVAPYLDFVFDREDIDSGEPLEFEPGDREELARFTSPPINEGNYEILADGTLRVRLPWFAVAFYGENEITMSVLDDNLYDFQRYQQVQQNGGLLSPGEIPNILDPIEGGAGIFGSMARVSRLVNVLPEAGN